jgi:hypothetical protein
MRKKQGGMSGYDACSTNPFRMAVGEWKTAMSM